MIVERLRVHPQLLGADDRDAWPWTVPCVRALVGAGVTLPAPVTFLVGENGSGKSTVVEAVAEAFGLDSYGGRGGSRYASPRERSALGERLRLEYTPRGLAMASGPRSGRRGFFLRAESAMRMMAEKQGWPGYWEERTDLMSHGEGFLTVFESMFRGPGLYVLDEPEAALSFTSSLRLVALLQELGRSGAQVVCATHSPILAATPDAAVLEVGEHGIRPTRWQDLALVDHWRRYLERPESYLRHLT
ncbi:AAA family ATPase [Streptomyces sp. BE20]|uniref:AAA family ATPase n=1 Tax=Streptomyces sp. BE20 TaxID=3002525 RepID=UPI002E76A490|nr:AAA family ATPase [Streptomyces sp. BE20]MEE1825695.1 AAA family ATPase [Streptomyces sp. BE20]